jgi:hypothetical protein
MLMLVTVHEDSSLLEVANAAVRERRLAVARPAASVCRVTAVSILDIPR